MGVRLPEEPLTKWESTDFESWGYDHNYGIEKTKRETAELEDSQVHKKE